MNGAVGRNSRAHVAPLTHHQMLSLAEPFLRRSYAPDLDASDRAARRLAFRPRLLASSGGIGPIREAIVLDCYVSGSFRLTRTLDRAGLVATTRTSGRDLQEMLQAIEAFPADRHFAGNEGAAIALSYEIAGDRRRILARALLRTDSVDLTLTLAAVRGVAAEAMLTARNGRRLWLPEDLLAVLGWDWSPLVAQRTGWQASLRLRGSLEQRGRRAVVELERAARHLQQALSGTPGEFHDRCRRARWAVVLRRLIPWLTVVALAAAVAALPRLVAEPQPATLMLMFHIPTVLIALSFCLQERAKFEFPPRPRRSGASDWTPEPPTSPAEHRLAVRWWNSPFR
jgi:hypothetical protein